MKTEVLKNKEGEVLKTQDGKELKEHTFEPGDEFIPCINKVIEKSHEAIVKGKKQVMTKYSIPCRVRDSFKKTVTVDGNEEIFIRLTPTQAKSLKKKIESGIEINQQLFVAYNYMSVEWGEQIGIGIKGQSKPPKKFDDFDDRDFVDASEYEPIEEEDFVPED